MTAMRRAVVVLTTIGLVSLVSLSVLVRRRRRRRLEPPGGLADRETGRTPAG